MKAIIPVAGAGTKLRPLTYTQPKPLVPLAGKPMIGYIVDALKEAGIKKFVFIVGYLGEKIKHYLDTQYPTTQKEFVYQEPREGTGHAIWQTSRMLLDHEPIIIHFGDTILELDLERFVHAEESSIGIHRTETPGDFGVVTIDDENHVELMVEKPIIPKSNMAMVGLYKINDVKLFKKSLDFIVKEDVRTHGELQLTDALMHMIEQGTNFKAVEVDHWWDCGHKDKLLLANAVLLEKYSKEKNFNPQHSNSIIIPPVSLGKNCKITDSIIGPNVSIGDESRIHRSVLWNSIVGNFSELNEAVMKDSILGNDVVVRGISQSLNIGDNADIDLGV